MSKSLLLNVDNRAGVRVDKLAFAQYFGGKGKDSCLYAIDFDGKGKLYLKEPDPDEGKRLLNIVTDAVMKCGDKRARIAMPHGGFVATEYIGGVEPSNDGTAAVVTDLEGQALFWFSEDDYESVDEVISELIEAVNSSNKRRPHLIDWSSLRKTESGQEHEEFGGSDREQTNPAVQASTNTAEKNTSKASTAGALASKSKSNSQLGQPDKKGQKAA